MRKFWNSYHRYMIKPILYQIIARLMIVITLGLLWLRFVNTRREITLVGYVCPIAGMLLIAVSWFHYLRMDGIKVLQVRSRTQKRKRFFFRSMIDDTQEEVTNLSSLDSEDRTACMFLVNLVSGLILLVITFIGTKLGMNGY